MAKPKSKPKRKKLSDAEKFARRVARRCELLAPQLPHIDRHDLELIVAEQLKTPEERMQVMFLKRHDEGFLSFDETLLIKLIEALAQAKVDAILFNNTAAIVSGASAPKKKIDLLVHDHAALRSKLEKFAQAFGVARLRPYKAFSKVVRAMGRSVSVDFVLAHSSRKSFESLKSRAKRICLGMHELYIATLEDIIAAEEAVGRPQDKAAFQIVREALGTKEALDKHESKDHQRRKHDVH